MQKTWLVLVILILSSCSRAPIKNTEDSMRPVRDTPEFMDTLSSESFFIALKKHIAVMKTSNLVADPMIFGKKKIAKTTYISSLEEILNHESDWVSWIGQNFDFHEVYGRDDWGEIMSTGYYEPKVMASRSETSEFSQPVYSTPPDLITIDLKSFANKFPKGDRLPVLQGRMANQNFTPYYSRQEIDEDLKLKGRKLELAWLNPIDAFFIQIQGSGLVEFEDGEKMRIGYDNQNGHTYYAIGKFLTNVIPMEEMSMQRIRTYLETLPKKEQQKILNKNPSYVFFRKLDTKALTYAGMEVEDGRTIATDAYFFPKGALAFLDIEEPEFNTTVDWVRKPRLVFDQDTGGAIRGPDRVDLFFGQGEEAAQKAGVMKQKGKLFYLIPKSQ